MNFTSNGALDRAGSCRKPAWTPRAKRARMLREATRHPNPPVGPKEDREMTYPVVNRAMPWKNVMGDKRISNDQRDPTDIHHKETGKKQKG